MQTAMQMAIEHYENLSAQGSNQAYVIARFLKEKFLPLEKQQIVDAYNEGYLNISLGHDEVGERYYNETYKK